MAEHNVFGARPMLHETNGKGVYEMPDPRTGSMRRVERPRKAHGQLRTLVVVRILHQVEAKTLFLQRFGDCDVDATGITM